jgi:ribulose 1,5-bisphosphate synthetase/thiazole synthase
MMTPSEATAARLLPLIENGLPARATRRPARVLIAGAGMAGLVAAYELQRGRA